RPLRGGLDAAEVGEAAGHGPCRRARRPCARAPAGEVRAVPRAAAARPLRRRRDRAAAGVGRDVGSASVITRVRSVGIYVSDQQRALEFYRDVLGCDVLVDTPMGEGEDAPRWIEVRLPRDDVNLLLFTPEGQAARVGT